MLLYDYYLLPDPTHPKRLPHRQKLGAPSAVIQYSVRLQTAAWPHPLQNFCHAGTDATAAARRTTTVSLELEHKAERAAWNSTASCVVVGDASGRLHFVTGEGTLIFSQPLAKPAAHRARY